MTITELIELLSAYPPDTEVVVDGYEFGFDVPWVHEATVRENPDPVGYAGSLVGDSERDNSVDVKNVVVIARA